MKQIELTSKLVVALITIVVVFSAMTVPSVVAQSTSSPPIRANSVTSGSIKDGEVKTQDLANNAVTSPKIADGTIQEQDIADGVIPDGGGAIELHVRSVQGNVVEIGAGGHGTSTAACADGETLTGGGFFVNGGIEVTSALDFLDINNKIVWQVEASNEGNFGGQLFALAFCMEATIP